MLVLVLMVAIVTSTIGCATKNNYSRTTERWYPDGKLQEKSIVTDKGWSVNQPFAGTSRPERGHAEIFHFNARVGGGWHGGPLNDGSAYGYGGYPIITVPAESQQFNINQTWRRVHDY